MGEPGLAGLSFCIADGKAVFLDIARDRYFALPADFSRFATGRIPHLAADSDEIVAVVETLLPSSIAARHPSLCTPPPAVTHEIVDRASRTSPWLCLPALLGRILFYKLLLRTVGLDRTLRRLSPRGASVDCGERYSSEHLVTVGAAISMLKRYMPLADQCLPVALAVADYLRRRGWAPQLVLGVMARPFRAHSWVQLDTMLLTDRIEAVRNFTPILVL
ncbi:lasso peptide biosynthesis B2 protein [Sphingomonas oryzagri]